MTGKTLALLAVAAVAALTTSYRLMTDLGWMGSTAVEAQVVSAECSTNSGSGTIRLFASDHRKNCTTTVRFHDGRGSSRTTSVHHRPTHRPDPGDPLDIHYMPNEPSVAREAPPGLLWHLFRYGLLAATIFVLPMRRR